MTSISKVEPRFTLSTFLQLVRDNFSNLKNTDLICRKRSATTPGHIRPQSYCHCRHVACLFSLRRNFAVACGRVTTRRGAPIKPADSNEFPIASVSIFTNPELVVFTCQFRAFDSTRSRGRTGAAVAVRWERGRRREDGRHHRGI